MAPSRREHPEIAASARAEPSLEQFIHTAEKLAGDDLKSDLQHLSEALADLKDSAGGPEPRSDLVADVLEYQKAVNREAREGRKLTRRGRVRADPSTGLHTAIDRDD